MNEEQEFAPIDRPKTTARFFSRLHRYRNLFLRRWWVLALAVGLALASMAAYMQMAPQEFISAGEMIVSIKLNIQQGSLYTEELGNFLGTQQALMQGSEVMQHASDSVRGQYPNLPPCRVTLTVSVLPKTTIFKLRARGENAEYTKAFLQACMDEYINIKKGMAERTSTTTIAGLTDQILRLEPAMQASDDQIQVFLGTNDAALLQEASSVGDYLSILYQKQAAAQSEFDLLQTMTLDQNLLLEQDRTPALLGGARGGVQAGASVSGGVPLNPGLVEQPGFQVPNTFGMEYLTTKQEIQLLNAEQKRYAEYLKPKHPQMMALSREIEQLTRLLEIYRQQNIEQMDARKSALALQITNIANQVKVWGLQNLELSRKSAQYARLKAKSDRIQALYNSLLASLETLDINKDISPESVTVYQPATDALPDEPLHTKGQVAVGVVGLVLGLVILMLLDRMDDRMNTFTDLEELFDEDVLGQIPRERSSGRGVSLPLVRPDDPRHTFVESYRNLRSSLLFMPSTGTHPRSLLITSAMPNDGKSMTASNLAITLAAGGSRVLLVDADLRKGNLHNRFNLKSADAGLFEALSQGTDWRPSVKETGSLNLWLLPCGTNTQRLSELFVGQRMEQFLQDSKKEYDYVLMDTAPVMVADDVTSLAPRMEGVIFVIRAEVTSARVARAALNMLYQRKSRVLGLVFNSVRASASDYYYYYRYRDYYTPNRNKPAE